MRQVDVPVVSSFVDDHRENLTHGVIGALDAIVVVRVVGTRRDAPHVQKLVNGKCQLGAEFQSMIGEEAGWAPLKRYVIVDQDTGGAFSREFRSRVSVHVCASAEPIRDE